MQVKNLTPNQEPPDSEALRKSERKLQWQLRDSSDEQVQEMYKQLLADPKPEAAMAAQVYKRVLDRRMGQGRGRGGRAGRGGREQPRSVAAGSPVCKLSVGAGLQEGRSASGELLTLTCERRLRGGCCSRRGPCASGARWRLWAQQDIWSKRQGRPQQGAALLWV